MTHSAEHQIFTGSGALARIRPTWAREIRSAGFSLIELMVAMVLGVFVMGGALMVFVSTSSSYRAQEATAQMMEAGRTAVELISRDLRMSQYWKCIGWQAANLSADSLPYQQRGLFAINGPSTAPDVLRTMHALDEDPPIFTTADVTLAEGSGGTWTSNSIPVDDSTRFSSGDIIVINDCAKGDVFAITGKSGNSLTHACGEDCQETYLEDSEVLRVEDTVYAITTNDQSQPALYRSVNGATAQELLAGVENMQLFFGEDTDGDGMANRYVTADVINAPCAAGTNPNCWLRVVSVRISLLMRTLEDNVTQEAQTYTYNGSTITATDKRLRRPFTAVVALRNQFNN